MPTYDLTGPAMAPPAGVTANFDNPGNDNATGWTLLTFMMAVSTICVLVRMYAKLVLMKALRVEDLMILAAYGNYWGCAWATYSFLYTPGFFVHTWDLALGDEIYPYYLVFVYGVFYSVVLALLKVAILVDFCRVFVVGKNGYLYWGSIAIGTLQILFCIAAIFLLNFQCVPHEAVWDFTIDAYCLPLNALQITSSTVHIVSDIGIFVLPQKTIWGLQMSLKRKIGVAILFGLGALSVVCAILRMIKTVDFGASLDKMYTICPVILWATGEMTCAFFVCCMPYLPRVFKETKWLSGLRKFLHIKTSRNSTPHTCTTGHKTPKSAHLGGAPNTSQGRSKDVYSNLTDDDYDVEMGTLKENDSTERLRQENVPAARIMRTTHFTVVSEDRNTGPASDRIPSTITPWANSGNSGGPVPVIPGSRTKHTR